MKASALLQTVATALKLTLIVGFIIAAFVKTGHGDIRWEILPRYALSGRPITWTPIWTRHLTWTAHRD